jgi:hypothetical protein
LPASEIRSCLASDEPVGIPGTRPGDLVRLS